VETLAGLRPAKIASQFQPKGGTHIAIYSLNIKIQSRGKGKSAIAAAAYIAGERFKNEYDGLTHDRSERTDVVHKEILLPKNAPHEFSDRATLWNAVELSERAKNAQLCRSLRLALPRELNLAQNISLVHEYVHENFISRGMCADYAIHDKGNGNPHAHILLTMRPIEKDGTFGAKSRMEYILDNNGEKIKLPSGRYKTRKITITDWDNRANAELWRENWAKTLNKHLEFHEHNSRVDHRS
jgi:ATP-dependent exoDNAse (exonuclease V) alpha subunit